MPGADGIKLALDPSKLVNSLTLCAFGKLKHEIENSAAECVCAFRLSGFSRKVLSLPHTRVHACMHAERAGLEKLILFQLWLQTAGVITGKLSTCECFGAEKLILPSKGPRRATKQSNYVNSYLIKCGKVQSKRKG